MERKFELKAPFKPTGDQPQAIDKLVKGLSLGYRDQTLLGVTGSGKTYTMANVIARAQRPTLVISHNKTLAAQLAAEFQEYFPNNAVHYFVSYYDYYQPEAYMPATDTYIEKETDINEEIDRLRHSATAALMTRRDVIIVASVSCIYGLGSPAMYRDITVTLNSGQRIKRDQVLKQLVRLKYDRNDIDFHRGTFRVKGETLDIFPSMASETALRLEFYGDVIERIVEFDPLTGETISLQEEIMIFPAKHYVSPPDKIEAVMREIRQDLKLRLEELNRMNKLVEAQRLEQRVRFDLEMMANTGYCTGVENYSRYFDGRQAGDPSFTLIDYFPKDLLMFIDESHITLPQIGGMYFGDRARKDMLVEYGFRLPAAYDNRPLKASEFETKINQVIYASATPNEEELGRSKQVVEQLVRPTGLLDPVIDVRTTLHQVDDLIKEINDTVKKGERVLVTTLTKRMSEDLTDYLKEIGIKVQYLHSEVDTMERLEILRDLRLGKYDVVVGINLLREGLDLPEVSLVAILDADKEGFLRSTTALIQTMGRVARHEHGRVIMYADNMTGSMKRAIDETIRRRTVQEAYNKKNGIVPKGIKKEVRSSRLSGVKAMPEMPPEQALKALSSQRFDELLHELEEKMNLAARNLEFEEAASLRDQIAELKRVRR